MATNRKRRARHIREGYSDAKVEFLLTGNEDRDDESEWWEIFAWEKEARRVAWEDLREGLLADWIEEHPGTRPWAWWKYDAPKAKAPGVPDWHLSEMVEPRLRVGGSGAPSWEKYPAILPYFTRGIPDSWEGFDKADPPLIESEASYLKRLGLFLPGEEKRLPADAFEPERVEC